MAQIICNCLSNQPGSKHLVSPILHLGRLKGKCKKTLVGRTAATMTIRSWEAPPIIADTHPILGAAPGQT